MLRRIAGIMAFCLFSISASVQTSSSSSNPLWTPIGKDIFLNEQTLTHISDAVHSLWVRIFPEKDSLLYNRSVQKLKDMGKDHTALAYIGYLTEIDCRNLRYREISTMFYRKDSNIIASLQNQELPWKEIPDNNMVRAVYRTVCSDFPADAEYGGPC